MNIKTALVGAVPGFLVAGPIGAVVGAVAGSAMGSPKVATPAQAVAVTSATAPGATPSAQGAADLINALTGSGPVQAVLTDIGVSAPQVTGGEVANAAGLMQQGMIALQNPASKPPPMAPVMDLPTDPGIIRAPIMLQPHLPATQMQGYYGDYGSIVSAFPPWLMVTAAGTLMWMYWKSHRESRGH